MVSTHDRDELWIRDFGAQTGDGRARLVCFPHAGGAASFFHPLVARLGGTDGVVDVLAVQYPGRQDRRSELPPDTLEELVDGVFDELKHWTDRPLLLFGHSMGAVIAYEVARRLERDTDTPPLGLFASGRRAPSVHVEENVHRRGDDGLIAELRELSGTAAGLLDDKEVLAMILPALRADYRAIETYRHLPGPILKCPITAFVGAADHRAPLDQVRPWQRHTTGAFDLQLFPGGHFYLSEQWPAVADAVRSGFAACEAAVQNTSEREAQMLISPSSSSHDVCNVILRGGPAHLPDEERVLHVTDLEAPVKLLDGNGYEHFWPTAETVVRDGRSLRVFVWKQRTYIAE